MSRRWRRLSRIRNFAVCAPARCARRGDGNSGTSLRWNCTSSLIAQTRCIVRTIGTSSGPSMRSAKSTRGGFCPGVFTSSMMLIPPTNAMRPSMWRELAVQSAQPMRAKLPRRDLGSVLEQRHVAADEIALDRRSQIVLGAPAVDQHANDDAALRCANERRGDDPADVVVGVDVGLEPDLALGAVDRVGERREVFAAASKQCDAVPGEEPVYAALPFEVERRRERRVVGDPAPRIA